MGLTMWTWLVSLNVILFTISSCAQPPYLNLLEDNIPEEYPESHLPIETGGMTDTEISQYLQQLNDLRTGLGARGWGALRGKRSLADFFSEKSALPHLAWSSWHQDRMQRGKKQELRHLPWQMDLKSPMLR